MQGNLQDKVGVDDAEDPPVPIPNTEVKLSSAEDTWLVTAWENRKTPTFVYFLICFVYFVSTIFLPCMNNLCLTNKQMHYIDIPPQLSRQCECTEMYWKLLLSLRKQPNMLFKSTTGDLSNK